MKIGFIGAGKVGFSLGKYFSENGICIAGYFSKTEKSAIEASVFTKSRAFKTVKQLIAESDIIFITVPDDNIKIVWDSIKHENITGKIFCHCSGLISSKVFEGIEKYNAYGYSLHMFFAVSDKYSSYKSLNNTIFTLEGSTAYINKIKSMIEGMGNTVEIILAENKEKYHASAVMGSNFVVALAEISVSLLKECGFTEKSALNALIPLMEGNISNIKKQGVINSLTGPIERNDIETIKKHIECLNEKEKEIYISLSKVLIDIGEKKHPNTNYEKLKKELEI